MLWLLVQDHHDSTSIRPFSTISSQCKCFPYFENQSDHFHCVFYFSWVKAVLKQLLHPSIKLRHIGVPNSRFVLKVIIKSLISKLSLSSILKTPNRLHPIYDFQPNLSVSEYLNQIPYCYSTWYSTSIKANSRVIFE